MKKMFFLSAMLLALFFVQACNNSGSKDSKQRADSVNHANKPLTKEASDFMVDAAIINLNEIKLGSIAREKATTSRVRDYGTMIKKGHQKINQKLKTLAQNKNVKLPDSLDQQHQSNAADLKEKEGNDLGEAFVKDMVKGHKAAIKKYKKAERRIDDSDIRSFIELTLPDLQTHLDSARVIRDDLEGDKQ